MTYVPIVVPPSSPQPPSPRARELASLLTKVLEEYQKAHPSVTSAEMRAAIRLAQSATGKDNAKAALVISLVLGLMMAGLGVGLLVMGETGAPGIGGSMPMILVAVIVFLAIVMAVVKLASK